jgi:hypothetical protein
MGLIHVAMFATLDLVAQSPDDPNEDPVGFPWPARYARSGTGTST